MLNVRSSAKFAPALAAAVLIAVHLAAPLRAQPVAARPDPSAGLTLSPDLRDAKAPAAGPASGQTFTVPPVTVVGQKPGLLREEQPRGSYGQPGWTAQRRFVDSRVYVIPENQVEVEFWMIPRFRKSGATDIRWLEEIEVGLPHRFQLDLYFRQDTEDNKTRVGGQFEVRYALADWGKIPGNPTLYFEYAPIEAGPPLVEVRLLLGDQLAPRWHWAVNLSAEFQLGGEHEQELAVNTAVSYTVLDDKFSVGFETEFEFTTSRGQRRRFQDSLLAGPSFQWKPTSHTHVDLAPLIGLTHESPDARVYLIFGYSF